MLVADGLVLPRTAASVGCRECFDFQKKNSKISSEGKKIHVKTPEPREKFGIALPAGCRHASCSEWAGRHPQLLWRGSAGAGGATGAQRTSGARNPGAARKAGAAQQPSKLAAARHRPDGHRCAGKKIPDVLRAYIYATRLCLSQIMNPTARAHTWGVLPEAFCQ